jgi:hypothetical protein
MVSKLNFWMRDEVGFFAVEEVSEGVSDRPIMFEGCYELKKVEVRNWSRRGSNLKL